MKLYRILTVMAGFYFAIISSLALATTITGAGATFPYPLYAKWAELYKKQTGIAINYQSIGSSSGIKQTQAKIIDFGASDIPLTASELAHMQLVQFPTVLGGIVPVVNIKGIRPGQLKLTGPVLADIYLGKITRWNDARITQINPTLTLPDQNITTLHRADGSGTTFIFTHYLSQVSMTWKNQVGTAPAIRWPNGIGGKGNEGIAQYLKRIPGSIGYIEYAYVKQSNMPYVQLQNKNGFFIHPSKENFSAAALHAHWKKSEGFYEVLTNQTGKNSWPMVAATFIVMSKNSDNLKNTKTILQFFQWAYTKGREQTETLDYISLPPAVISSIQSSWKEAFFP